MNIIAFRIYINEEYVATWHQVNKVFSVNGKLLRASHKDLDDVLQTLYVFRSTSDQDYADFLLCVSLLPVCSSSEYDDIPF